MEDQKLPGRKDGTFFCYHLTWYIVCDINLGNSSQISILYIWIHCTKEIGIYPRSQHNRGCRLSGVCLVRYASHLATRLRMSGTSETSFPCLQVGHGLGDFAILYIPYKIYHVLHHLSITIQIQVNSSILPTYDQISLGLAPLVGNIFARHVF